jgi:glycosyltransferase involved in cell wall biosynthesis
MKPIAFVTPWFGKDQKGGAEQQAWQLATRLAARGHKIEVLTTCCRSFFDNWSTNHFRAGKHKENNLVVRRFRVNRQRRNDFDHCNAQLLAYPSGALRPGVQPVSNQIAEMFVRENINSKSMMKHFQRRNRKYHAFIFLPYLYGPILNGLLSVADKAFLQPCLHDEIYAYLPAVARIFYAAQKIIYNSEGEALLAESIFGPAIITKGMVMGEGVEIVPEDISQLPAVVGPINVKLSRYVLYLGRRDQTKNVDMLVDAFRNFREQKNDSQLKLVLAGSGSASYGEANSGIIDLGLVSEKEKSALLANCLAVFQPSHNESFSRVLMEAWLYRRPVAAHSKCLATALAVEKAQGGWVAGTGAEWTNLFAAVENLSATTQTQLGKNGHAYAKKFADWDVVIDRYEKVLGLLHSDQFQNRKITKRRTNVRKNRLESIHQSTPCLTVGDAISNQALLIQRHLRHLGYRSDIYVESHDPSLSEFTRVVGLHKISKGSGLIYHHSIGSKITQQAVNHAFPKCLVYHNITPAEFVKPYDLQFSKLLEKGRIDMQNLSSSFPISVGDSYYNASELESFRFQSPTVLPICIDPQKWNTPAEPEIMADFQDGRTNLLFVGRIAPNKCQHHLIQAFCHYLSFDPDARLVLVGELLSGDAYSELVFQRIEDLGLSGYIIITGKVSDAQLQAYYRTSHLYWSMSEHEGFGVPLIEAMWFDIPVLAYKSSAVPETLNKAGMIFTTKDDLERVAALAKLCVHDVHLKNKILTAQRKRRLDFLPQVILPKIEELANRLEEQIH